MPSPIRALIKAPGHTSSPLQALPTEIRSIIWRHVFTGYIYHPIHRRRTKSPTGHPLSNVCQRLNLEINSFFERHATLNLIENCPSVSTRVLRDLLAPARNVTSDAWALVHLSLWDNNNFKVQRSREHHAEVGNGDDADEANDPHKYKYTFSIATLPHIEHLTLSCKMELDTLFEGFEVFHRPFRSDVHTLITMIHAETPFTFELVIILAVRRAKVATATWTRAGGLEVVYEGVVQGDLGWREQVRKMLYLDDAVGVQGVMVGTRR